MLSPLEQSERQASVGAYPAFDLSFLYYARNQVDKADHRPPEGLRDDRFPLHLRRRKVGVDDDCIIGKETHHRVQVLGLNSGEGAYDEII